MPRTQKKQKKHDHSADVATFVRDTIVALETDFDREALSLLFNRGVLAVDDPAQLADAIDRLRENPHHSDSICQLEQRLINAETLDERRRIFVKLEDATLGELDDVRETAYLLGIAVGRRLGSLALPAAPRARKAVA